MSIVITSPYGIDRKLHKIALNADPVFETAINLARDIAGQRLEEFSYKRKGQTVDPSVTAASSPVNTASRRCLARASLPGAFRAGR
jgi:hypothetical protein